MGTNTVANILELITMTEATQKFEQPITYILNIKTIASAVTERNNKVGFHCYCLDTEATKSVEGTVKFSAYCKTHNPKPKVQQSEQYYSSVL